MLLPSPATDDLETPRLVLRDGSVVTVRPATTVDRDAIRRFFHSLTPEDRYRRFLAAAEPIDADIDRYCGAQDPSNGVTLVALRIIDRALQVVAAASYLTSGAGTAEVAFAVGAAFQGHGVATLLLERLAAHAVTHGITRFVATTLVENTAMIEVFQRSGFVVTGHVAQGTVDISFALSLDPAAVARVEERRRAATVTSLDHLLRPRSIAVFGASRDQDAAGSRVLSALRTYGYAGPIAVVHPVEDEVQGIRTVRSLRQLPDSVDLAILAGPAAQAMSVVDDCGTAGVLSLMLLTDGYAESGPEAVVGQQKLADRARSYGMRLLGPNCPGATNFDPSVRMNASLASPTAPYGGVACGVETDDASLAPLDRAQTRQVGLSSLVGIGNRADVSSNDLLEYWEDDPAAKVILLHLASLGNPRRFARIARRTSRKKPVVVAIAGTTEMDATAAGEVSSILHEAGVICAANVDEMFDIAMCLDQQPHPEGQRVAFVTNEDPDASLVEACAAAGLTVAAPEAVTGIRFGATQAAATSHASSATAQGLDVEGYHGALEAVLDNPSVDAVVVLYRPPEIQQIDAVICAVGVAVAAARDRGIRKPVVTVITAGWPTMMASTGDLRLPVFASLEQALGALGRVAAYGLWVRSEAATANEFSIRI